MSFYWEVPSYYWGTYWKCVFLDLFLSKLYVFNLVFNYYFKTHQNSIKDTRLTMPKHMILTQIIFWVNYKLTHLWFNRNLSCLFVVWNMTLYPPEVWPKFMLLTCGSKYHDASVPLESFWYCIFMFFVFLEGRDIKVE